MAQLDTLTETGQALQALSLVREDATFDSLDDDPAWPARVCRKHFAGVRDGLLAERRWTFAEWYALLPALADPVPPFKWKAFYALPGDCLAVREINECDDDSRWRVVGRMVACNEPAPIQLTYTRRIVEVAQWDAPFRRLFVPALAEAIAPELAQDERIFEQVESTRAAAEQRSAPADAAQQTPDTLNDSDFEILRARF